MNASRPAVAAAMLLVLAGCASAPRADAPIAVTDARMSTPAAFTASLASTHRDGDDLLTAGLGLDGLRAMAPPAFADAARPTAAEARRRAIWSNWRGIADLAPGGGYGSVYGST